MLRYRLITGPILIVAILLVVWLDERIAAAGGSALRGVCVFAVGLLIAPLMARETAEMLTRVGVATRAWLAMLTATGAYVGVALLPSLSSPAMAVGIVATLLVAILLAGLMTFSSGRNIRGVMAATGGLLVVSVYAGVLLAFWPLIRRDHSAWLLVGAVLTTKSCDIGAYFTGVSIGRHKLIPWLSPKKSWEGLIGGVLTATLVGALLAWYSAGLTAVGDHLPVWLGALGGAMLGVVGQGGDLAESLFKRDAGVKDSGRILPGMGGVLDVLDSLLMAGPVVYWLLVVASLLAERGIDRV